MVTSEIALPHLWHQIMSALRNKSGMIPLSSAYDTKYRGKIFTDTNSDTDANPQRHMVAISCHLLLHS